MRFFPFHITANEPYRYSCKMCVHWYTRLSSLLCTHTHILRVLSVSSPFFHSLCLSLSLALTRTHTNTFPKNTSTEILFDTIYRFFFFFFRCCHRLHFYVSNGTIEKHYAQIHQRFWILSNERWRSRS